MMWNNQPFNYSNNYNYNAYQQGISSPYNNFRSQYYTSQKQNNIIWVNGKENVNAIQLPPNSSILLMDSQNDKFYIKTTDDIGLGKIRTFNYKEEFDNDNKIVNSSPSQEKHDQIDLSNYVTKAELEKALKGMKKNEK